MTRTAVYLQVGREVVLSAFYIYWENVTFVLQDTQWNNPINNSYLLNMIKVGQSFYLWQINFIAAKPTWVATSPQGGKKCWSTSWFKESLGMNHFPRCAKPAASLHQVACRTVWSSSSCRRSWTRSCAGTRASSWRASQRRTNRPSRSSAVSSEFRPPPTEELGDVVDRQHLRVALLSHRRGGGGGWVLVEKASVQHQNHSR